MRWVIVGCGFLVQGADDPETIVLEALAAQQRRAQAAGTDQDRLGGSMRELFGGILSPQRGLNGERD